MFRLNDFVAYCGGFELNGSETLLCDIPANGSELVSIIGSSVSQPPRETAGLKSFLGADEKGSEFMLPNGSAEGVELVTVDPPEPKNANMSASALFKDG